MGEELIHEDLTEEIIGAAMEVLNELKPGLDEKLYENALIIELRSRGHSVNQQKRFPVHYKGQKIGSLVGDHMAQMLGYLAITGFRLALLLNFKFSKLQWKRVIR